MSSYDPEVMKLRFWELTAMKEAVAETTAPLQAKADEMRERLRPMNAEYRKMLIELRDARDPAIDREMATLARALKNKVGLRPTVQ